MKYNSSWIATCLGDSVNSVRDSVVQSCVMRIFIGGCGAPHVKREVGFVDTPLRRVRHSQGGARDSSGFKLDFPLPGASVSAFHSVIECGNGGSFIFIFFSYYLLGWSNRTGAADGEGLWEEEQTEAHAAKHNLKDKVP